MMQSNPQVQAEIANLKSETFKNTAEGEMYGAGGAIVGPTVQAADGSMWGTTQYGGMRMVAPAPGSTTGVPPQAGSMPSATSGGGATAAPSTGSGVQQAAPVSLPTEAQSGSGNDGSVVPQQPIPGPTPPATPVGNPAAAAPTVSATAVAPPAGPTFLTPGQQKQAEAQGTAIGTTLGNAPKDAMEAVASSRAVNPLYAAGIQSINRALNILANDNGKIDTTVGINGLLSSRFAPGSPGYELGQQLHALGGLSALTTMGTERGGDGGGSPIQIRNQREFTAVAQAVGSLEQGQQKGDLINSLKALKQQLYAGMNNRAKDIGDLRKLGKLDGGIPASTADDPFAGPGPYGLIKAAPDGSPVVTTPEEAAQFPVGTVVVMPNGQKGAVTAQLKAAYGVGQ